MFPVVNQENVWKDSSLSDVMNQKVSPNALAESHEFVKLVNALDCLKKSLWSTSITSKIWLQCMDYIEVVNYFICCERLGMWDTRII